MDEKLIKQLEKADSILRQIDSEYITQQELEDVVALIIASIETSSEEFQAKMGEMSDAELAYYAKCSKAIEDMTASIDKKWKAQNDYMAKVHTKDIQDAVELAASKIATIKGDKGDPGIGLKGDPGEPGLPGKDAPAETPNEVIEKINKGTGLIDKKRVEGMEEFDKLRNLGAFNPTMGPSFSDLADIRRTITTVRQGAVTINYIIDGGGSAITTGVKGFVEIPYAMTITGWQVFADQVGSVVVDVWKSTYATFPPVVGGSIAGSELPTLASQQVNQNASLTTWTTSLSGGDVLAYNVQSASTVTRITVSLIGIKN